VPNLKLRLGLSSVRSALSRYTTPNLSYLDAFGPPPSPLDTIAMYAYVNRAVSHRLRAVRYDKRDVVYHIANDGDDNLSGLSAVTAWKSLEKVQDTLFDLVGSGDSASFLFQRGHEWISRQYISASDSITLATYGEGDKPIINAFDQQIPSGGDFWSSDGDDIPSGTTYVTKSPFTTEIAWLKRRGELEPLKRYTDINDVRNSSIPCFGWFDDNIYINLIGPDPSETAWEALIGINTSTECGFRIRGDSIWVEDLVLLGMGMPDQDHLDNQSYLFAHFADAKTNEAVVKGVEGYYGPYHLAGSLGVSKVGGVTTFVDCKWGYFRAGPTIGGTITVVHSEEGGNEHIDDNCILVAGNLWEDTLERPIPVDNNMRTGPLGHLGNSPADPIELYISRDLVLVAGDMSVNSSTGITGTPDPHDDMDEVRSIYIGETIDDPLRPYEVYEKPVNAVQIGCSYKYGVDGENGGGASWNGWSINTAREVTNVSDSDAYACVFKNVKGDKGAVINSRTVYNSPGRIYGTKGADADDFADLKLLNTVLVCADANASPNIPINGPNIRFCAVYTVNNPVTANPDIVASGTGGLGDLSTLPGMVMLDGSLDLFELDPALDASDYYQQPTGDFNNDKRGTESTIGEVTSGYTAGNAPDNPADVVYKLQFTVEPADTIIDEVITPAIKVAAANLFGDVMTGYVGSVSISISSGTGTLSGTKTQTPSSGVAVFNDLKINAVDTFALTAKSGSLLDAVSDNFFITSAFTPDDMTDIASWLPWDATKMFSDSIDGTPIVADAVCKAWKAMVGPNCVVSEISGAVGPTYKASNGLRGGTNVQMRYLSDIVMPGDFYVAFWGYWLHGTYLFPVANNVNFEGLGLAVTNEAQGFGNGATSSSVIAVDSSYNDKMFAEFARTRSTTTFRYSGHASQNLSGTLGTQSITLRHLFSRFIAGGAGHDSAVQNFIKEIFVVNGSNPTGGSEQVALHSWMNVNRPDSVGYTWAT
jgi:hypothetical protein